MPSTIQPDPFQPSEKRPLSSCVVPSETLPEQPQHPEERLLSHAMPFIIQPEPPCSESCSISSHVVPSRTQSDPAPRSKKHRLSPRIKRSTSNKCTTSPIPNFGTVLPEGTYPLLQYIYKDFLNPADETIILHDGNLNETCSEFIQMEFTLMMGIYQWVSIILIPELRPNSRRHWRIQLNALEHFLTGRIEDEELPSGLKTYATKSLSAEEVWHKEAHVRGLKPDLVLRLFEIALGVLEDLRGDQQDMIEWRLGRKADGWDDAMIEREDKLEEQHEMIECGLLTLPKRAGRPLKRGPEGIKVFGKWEDQDGNPVDPVFVLRPKLNSENELGKLLISFSKMLKHEEAEFMSGYWTRLIHVYTGWNTKIIVDVLG